jgi:hypothetical protein
VGVMMVTIVINPNTIENIKKIIILLNYNLNFYFFNLKSIFILNK